MRWVADDSLTRYRVSGVFDARDTASALAAIEASLKRKEYRITDKLILLAKQ